jgi:hypothetical protein
LRFWFNHTIQKAPEIVKHGHFGGSKVGMDAALAQ